MEISINNSNVDNKDNSNTKEYLENDNSNFSEINIITNENNNNGEKRNRNRNKFKNEIEKLNNNKSNDSNDLNDEFTIPPELHKTFIMTSILTIVGIILILVGILQSVITGRVLGGIMFWILSILVLIPGGFYSFQFYRAKNAQKYYERQEILDSIPKLQ